MTNADASLTKCLLKKWREMADDIWVLCAAGVGVMDGKDESWSLSFCGIVDGSVQLLRILAAISRHPTEHFDPNFHTECPQKMPPFVSID